MDPATSALLCTIQKALGVLCALLLLGRPAGVLDIAALLNCDAKTVRRHLDSLARQQLVRRHSFRNGYAVTPEGLYFWFGECGKFSHIAATTTTTTDINQYSSGDELNTGEVAAAAAVKMEKNGFSKKVPENGREEDEPLSDQAAENLAAFREEGVGLNRRVRRACQLPHVTPDYIHAQAKRLHLEQRYLAGLLLHVVESEDPFPSEEQLLDPDDPERYIRGKLASLYIVE